VDSSELSQCLPRVDGVELAPFNGLFMILDQVVDQAHGRPDRSPVPCFESTAC